MLMKIFSPLFLVVGVLGNIANFYAFNKSHMKAYSTFRFLSYLSVIDLFVLIIGLPQIITIAYTKNAYDFRHYSDLVCSLHSFLTMFFTHFSSILLAAVSIDRVYVLRKLRPNKKATPKIELEVRRNENQKQNKLLGQSKDTDCNKKLRNKSSQLLVVQKHTRRQFTSVEFITIIIAFIIFLVDSHFLIWMRLHTFDISDKNSANGSLIQEILCYPSEKDKFYSYFFKNIWPWLDLLLYCIIPFIIMIICSILIIFRLFKLSQSMKYLNKKTNRRTDERSFGNNEQSSIVIQKVKENNNLLKNKTDRNSSHNHSCLNISEAADNNVIKLTDSNDCKAIKRVISSNDIQKRRARKNRHIYNVLLCLNLVFFLLVTPVFATF
jgi:hypothetical protein